MLGIHILERLQKSELNRGGFGAGKEEVGYRFQGGNRKWITPMLWLRGREGRIYKFWGGHGKVEYMNAILWQGD